MQRRLGKAAAAVLLVLGTLGTTGAAACAAPPIPTAQAKVAPEKPHPPLVIGHRGASAYAPENTLAAIRKAAALGISWVENDVQRTKDGRLVVIHDDTLARTTDVRERFPGRAPWRIADFTLAEIKSLDAGRWFGRAFTAERVPTLEEYLRLLDNTGQSLLMELKEPQLYPGVERQALDLLARAGWLDRRHLGGRLIVQSFNAESLRTVHRLRPDVPTGFLGAPAVPALPQYAAFTDLINPPRTGLRAAYVMAVHRLNGAHGKRLRLFAWTVDGAAMARSVARLGVDGLISNNPDVVRDAVASPHRVAAAG